MDFYGAMLKAEAMAGNFRFKQFLVRQERTAMKVGTDGVLLGAWCRVDPAWRRMLDVGTGTGLIALMLAQRSAAGDSERFDDKAHRASALNAAGPVEKTSSPVIDALEIDAASAGQAAENVAASPWSDRIEVWHDSLQHFAAAYYAEDPVREGYDLVVSNPPYFTDSLLPPDPARTAARHTIHLTYEELLEGAFSVLVPEGLLAVILPFDQTEVFVRSARERGFSPERRSDVCPTAGSGPKRSMMEFRKMPGEERCGVSGSMPKASDSAPPEFLERDSLVIERDGPLTYTDEYKALTRDFYLKF